jgi:alkanesulfonate monooxygenase SsuD/methylene tetrahydromethanopterin reductase-like flavin-dependent oxidoreductase (luciferase family)
VLPQVKAGAESAGRNPDDVTLIVPVNVIVGDTDEERAADRNLLRGMLSFYGSTPNYAFIWDEAGFEGTTARVRERQKAGDMAGMAAQITDDHLATFCTESTWDGLADALLEKYRGIAGRLVLYNGLMGSPERIERFGEVARRIHAHL